jgi:hypothetical protein
MTRDWDDAFSSMAHIPGSQTLPERWARQAAEYRRSSRAISENIPYGTSPIVTAFLGD